MPSRAQTLVSAMLAGDRLALARLISKIENRDQDLAEVLERVFPLTGKAQVLGITGPPGAGKSTLVDQLAGAYRRSGKSVAIVCVDPSSPFSGGAILGDRIRMQSHSSDPGVFIRSLGTRGMHGGLSQATKEVVHLLDSARFDVILVETAGVGQTELDILRLAQTVIVLLVPESGDAIQVMKAGIMEIADVFAVNKSDRPQADQMVKELVSMVALADDEKHPWKPPVQKTEALHGKGVEELMGSIALHQDYLSRTGAREDRALRFLKSELVDLAMEQAARALEEHWSKPGAQVILTDLLARKQDPYQALVSLQKLSK
jgi:LAO/AO transport system kinase